MVATSPPSSIEAEQAVLGAVFMAPSAMDEVIHMLRPESFWRTSHQHIWRAMLKLNGETGQVFDWVTVANEIRRAGAMDECGGEDAVHTYLAEMSVSVPSTFALPRYAAIVHDRAVKREVILRAGDIRTMALDETTSALDVVSRFNQSAVGVLEESAGSSDADSATTVREALDELDNGGRKGLTTGYQALDRFSGGFVPGGLYIIGARPGQGKSALIGNMVERYQRQQVNVGVFPLEMTRLQMIQRMCALRADVNSLALRESRMSQVERARAVEAFHTLKTGIWYNDRPKQTVADVTAQTRVWHRKHGISVVFVDYLQIMGAVDRRLERRLQIAEMTQGLKNLARELNIVVVAACQINREVEKRGGNKKPTLADLKESGSIEEDADGVIGIYRENDPAPDAPTWTSQVGWMKNRHGGVGHMDMRFVRATTQFVEIDNRETEPDYGHQARMDQGYGRDSND